MRGVGELWYREIVWDIERACYDRRGHGGDEGSHGEGGLLLAC